MERENVENQYKAQKCGNSIWNYRGVILWYGRKSRSAYKWSYDVRDVAEPKWVADKKGSYRAQTKAKAIEHIDEMYAKGWLV